MCEQVEIQPRQGHVAPGYEEVAEQFSQNLREGGDIGAAFAAWVDGRNVIDIWGGFVDGHRTRPWRYDTIAAIFSGTKGLVAGCLLMLIDRGQLDLERPVADYWPEFRQNGKEAILVKHLVSHQAGLPGLTKPVTFLDATDPRRMADLVAQQAAISLPGRTMHYHALTFGWLCGELLRRIDGRTVGRFFEQELALPLGLDAWIGLPQDQETRVAPVERAEGFVISGTRNSENSEHERQRWSIWDNPPRFTASKLAINSPEWRRAEIPATNGFASARAMARYYASLAQGGALDGVRLWNRKIVRAALHEYSRGVDPFVNKEMAFGMGFQLQTAVAPFGPERSAFGHTGAGGSMHGAWPTRRTGFSYVTNTLRESEGADPRSQRLLKALHASVRSQQEPRDVAR